ncbi:MAG: hypothetical protein B7Z61_04310 [Acidobacteria bacterium 37-71-11]|nr:MAG: hypothetical protein B7Z61_04310 [Acidobacteria bacterium 37-71-11]
MLQGFNKLTEVERAFLILLGGLANDLTILGKLEAAADRQPTDELELKANAVLQLVLLRLLGARIWQSWKLLEGYYQGPVLKESTWLRDHTAIQEGINKLKRKLRDGCVWERIRSEFAYHYDADALAHALSNDVLGGEFELVSGERVINSFFISSEAAIWFSILKVQDDSTFSEAFAPLVQEAVNLTFELVPVIRELVAAFVDHVVNDLGGSWKVTSSTRAISVVRYEESILPLFGA